jgi:hypothetical protein
MESNVNACDSNASQPSATRSEALEMELWKHHAAFGGEDKNRMVGIATWLLTFSAGILWYVISQVIGAAKMTDSLADRATMASCLGLVVSFLAGYIALLYGGYANQNWRKADEIAGAN